jgi:hypothetical protein
MPKEFGTIFLFKDLMYLALLKRRERERERETYEVSIYIYMDHQHKVLDQIKLAHNSIY